MNTLNQMNIETRPLVRVRVRRKRRRSKKRFGLIGILVLFGVSLLLSTIGYLLFDPRYQSDLALAQIGIQHVQKAETLFTASPQNLFDAYRVSQAQQEFAAALKIFVQLDNDVQALPGVATFIPVYGSRLSVAQHLVPLAIALAQMGVTGCDILNLLAKRLHEPLNPQAQGITLADLTSIASNLQQMSSILSAASNEANQLQSADVQFDPRISKLVDSFHKNVPVFQGLLNDLEQLLPVAPALLGIGTPANYLIEILDSTELRPGGGFIGNYGIATLSGGRLADAHITDVDLLDSAFEATGKVIPFPSAYNWFDIAPASWELRDSNLDADFPTAARDGEFTYMQEGGNVPLQGVIAITPALIQHALAITGPIAVPEYNETVNAQNLIARIHYHQLGPAGEGPDSVASPDGHSSLRKRFTELLAEHFLARIHQLPPTDSGKLFQVLIDGLRSKDLQIYFNAGEAEALLQHAHMDAAIQPASGDDLFVVDANIGANKANSFIVNTMDEFVTLDNKGNAIHHLTLNYAWTLPGQAYGNDTYRDYVRVYVPNGSILQMQDGWQYLGTSNSFGHEVWSGYFTLTYGQSNTITLTWSVPHMAIQNAQGWHYQDTIQRQAGTQWMVHRQIVLPSCASMTGESGGLKAADKQTEKLSQFLTENTTIEVNYVC